MVYTVKEKQIVGLMSLAIETAEINVTKWQVDSPIIHAAIQQGILAAVSHSFIPKRIKGAAGITAQVEVGARLMTAAMLLANGEGEKAEEEMSEVIEDGYDYEFDPDSVGDRLVPTLLLNYCSLFAVRETEHVIDSEEEAIDMIAPVVSLGLPSLMDSYLQDTDDEWTAAWPALVMAALVFVLEACEMVNEVDEDGDKIDSSESLLYTVCHSYALAAATLMAARASDEDIRTVIAAMR